MILVLLWLEEFHYVNPSTVLATSWMGAALSSWAIWMSLSLPFLVWLEGWLIRKSKSEGSYWFDLVLVVACVVLLVGLILYSLSHLRML
jgi:hypothetical protein